MPLELQVRDLFVIFLINFLIYKRKATLLCVSKTRISTILSFNKSHRRLWTNFTNDRADQLLSCCTCWSCGLPECSFPFWIVFYYFEFLLALIMTLCIKIEMTIVAITLHELTQELFSMDFIRNHNFVIISVPSMESDGPRCKNLSQILLTISFTDLANSYSNLIQIYGKNLWQRMASDNLLNTLALDQPVVVVWWPDRFRSI